MTWPAVLVVGRHRMGCTWIQLAVVLVLNKRFQKLTIERCKSTFCICWWWLVTTGWGSCIILEKYRSSSSLFPEQGTNTVDNITNLQTVWKSQPGSILCLAWEQLLMGNWDHKSSVSAAMLAAAAWCSVPREEDLSWADASRHEKYPSAPSTKLILKRRPAVCGVILPASHRSLQCARH